jgi:activator of HSP90 ATPase
VATETIQVSSFIDGSPMKVYTAWLSSKEHSAFTGSKAEVTPKVGGRFSAWDGYIQGANRELLEGRRIVQSWRTTEFPQGSPDSLLTVHFDPQGRGTHLTLVHCDIPQGQGRQYEEGWVEFYLEPLARYFAPAKKKVPAKKKAAKPKKAPARPAAKLKKKPAKKSRQR